MCRRCPLAVASQVTLAVESSCGRDAPDRSQHAARTRELDRSCHHRIAKGRAIDRNRRWSSGALRHLSSPRPIPSLVSYSIEPEQLMLSYLVRLFQASVHCLNKRIRSTCHGR